ncbi:MAG: ABC transporter substrate-binding protein [Candidatus Cloacimonetes bacterium]|nr:ABC transporter substrate-binding protein [Candidatus Cloacimonadota bacterium]MCF7813734.1 ABC transporter substrate-binding protein [Candidatus Cloacimonadota bacterium]MCF7867800.1 ABC transporter substrate-binding protein [Candidatus Cloacimonadota bacterium]MCF7883222.1 ABC transporter substrate-binding protein [Candidatus Cloacimonadota bacterium]
MMKKAILIFAIAMLLLAGCGQKQKTENDVTEVIFWQAMGGPLGDALAELIKKFNDTHPDIHVTSINMGNYTALSQKLMASIQTGNQPHVAQAYEAWISNFIDGEVIIPIEDFIAKDPNFGKEELADIYPVFIKSNTMNGKLVSFPFNKSVRVQYYNKDILFQNDLDPNIPPKTWEEFLHYSDLLTQDLDGDGKIDQYGTTLKISAWQFENLLLQAGGEIMNEDNTKPLFNSKEGVEALEYLNTLLNVNKSAYLSPGYEGQKDFTARKIAFYEDSSVSMAYMLRTGIDFNLGISAIPIKETKRNIISGTNVVIFDSENDKVEWAAWEFVKWFTEAAQTARWSELTYYMPVRKSAFQEEAIKKRLESNPEIASVYEQLEHATFEPQISEWFETRKYLEEQVIEKVLRGTLKPQKALDNAAKMIKEKIAKSKE